MSIELALRNIVRDVIREELSRFMREEFVAASAPKPSNDSGEFLSLHEAANVVHVHPATLRGWVNSGRLRGYRAGRHHRVKRAELETFMTTLPRSTECVDIDSRASRLAAA